MYSMNRAEWIKGLFQRDESMYEPSKIQDRILTIASQWRIMGVPWWTQHLMFNALRDEDVIKTYDIGWDVSKLTKRNGLEIAYGKDIEVQEPQAEIQLVSAKDGGMPFYRITEEGNKMRGRIY